MIEQQNNKITFLSLNFLIY